MLTASFLNSCPGKNVLVFCGTGRSDYPLETLYGGIDLILPIFRPPNDGESVQECKSGDINDAISLEYEQFFCGYGTVYTGIARYIAVLQIR